ncbi:MAG TPA: sugar phosphate nucleotidyltransferase [Polyangia bacterium]|jgi:NDP-sugar pyrophosphorylase family protein|nr:sugar phosphate nucleotidyltransferase [Polyangia bacterium]
MQCVILAGGRATRMRPLTDQIPKALIPVAGRPFVDHQLEWLAAHGVTDVVLSVGYRGDAIRAFVEKGDGARHGVRVRFVDEGADLRGTAGALRLALDEGALADSFLVTYGDSFLPIDFGDVFRAFEVAAQPALMTVFRNDGRWDTSNVIFDGRMVTLYDKQRRTRPAEDFTFIDYGLSALSRRVIADEVAAGVVADLATLFHALSVSGRLAGFEAAERFYEIGSPAGLEDFERWLRRDR